MKLSLLVPFVVCFWSADPNGSLWVECPQWCGQDIPAYASAHRMQRFLLKLPAAYDSTKQYPLVIGLHGNGGNAEGLSPAFAHFAEKQIFVALPDGQYPRRSGGYSWYYETSNKMLWKKFDTLSISNLLEIIREVSGQYSIGKVFVFGFSQGASLAYMAGLRNPELISGVATVAGSMPEVDNAGAALYSSDIARAKHLKVFIARGTGDTMMRRPLFNAQVDFFTKQGYEVTSYEFDAGHSLTDELMEQVLQWIKDNSH